MKFTHADLPHLVSTARGLRERSRLSLVEADALDAEIERLRADATAALEKSTPAPADETSAAA